ncbi:MAG: thioester reductase domain-containing protein [Nevskia sp.]|nr:thioester reductase domain-containing protein [Nevskia sp.]
MAILLTGATGFLGSHLLAELLARTGAGILCLVRAGDRAAGLARLREAACRHGLPPADEARLEAVPGDLAAPLLGMDEAAFAALAARVETIYHAGAVVNWAYPYAALKATNVLGTQEVLRLACRGRAKPVHHVSSIAVFLAAGRADADVIAEDDDLDGSTGLYGGYAQSKWVAEKMAATARGRGLPVTVYRPGLIGGSRGGADDFLARLVQGCRQLGAAPALGLAVDVAPVEYVAAAIVHLSRQAAAPGRAFHLVNPAPLPWDRFAAWLQGAAGRPLPLVPYEPWQARLQAACRAEPSIALRPLLPFLAAPGFAAQLVRLPPVDCRHALAGLAGSGIACPPVDAGLLDGYYGHLAAAGAPPR